MPDEHIFQQLHTTSRAPYSRTEYARKLAWAIIGAPLVRFSPRPMRKFRVCILRAFGANIAWTVNIRPSAKIWHPWIFTMGEHSCLADGVLVYNLGPLSIGDHTVISQRVHICNGSHDYSKSDLPLLRPTSKIGSGVWICADAFIGPGVTIGNNAIVGACAVVTHDVPPTMIVAGNPAVVIRERPRPIA